jgi:ceramide glucosyltransferase
VVLVATARSHREGNGRRDRRRITVFKPLARTNDDCEFARLRRCLESFVADLDPDSELLIGCHQVDEQRLQAFVRDMKARHPAADLRLVVDAEPERYAANPKVSWLRILRRHATGELWFWSDADILAPPGTIRSLRADFAESGGGLVTSPYVIHGNGRPAELLDTLFVNVEFYPGVVLMGHLDLVRFAFGSGMLFEAARFREKIDWDFLGKCLADDFHVGRLLAPTRLGSTRLTTVPSSKSWWKAILHYLRWQKTIRWCRPGSYAAQLVILPILGWLAWLLLDPMNPLPWLGLLAVMTADAITAVVISRLVGARLGWWRLWVVPLWSLVRGLTWLYSWIPLPIVWRGRWWWSPYRSNGSLAELLQTRHQPGVD